MRKLTIEQALKTPNIIFLVTNEQWLEINKVIKKDWKNVVALCVTTNLLYGYWRNELDFHDIANKRWKEIQLINIEEQAMIGKKLEITPPEGYEIDVDNSTFSCIQFRRIPIKTINKWEEIGSISGYYINGCSSIQNVGYLSNTLVNQNLFKTKEQAESCLAFSMYSQLKEYNNSYEVLCEYLDKSKPMLEILFGELTDQYIALFKLIKLRDIANGDWIPDWKDDHSGKSVIYYNGSKFSIDIKYTYPKILYFKYDQIADKFIHDNIKLLNIAKYLI